MARHAGFNTPFGMIAVDLQCSTERAICHLKNCQLKLDQDIEDRSNVDLHVLVH